MWVRLFNSSTLLLFISIAFATHGFAQATTVRFVDGQGETLADVEPIIHEDKIFLPVDTLNSVFDSELKLEYHRPRQRLTLKTKGKEIRLHIGNPSVSIDSGKQTFTLSEPPRVLQGQPMLPIVFFIDILPKIEDIEVQYNANLQRIRIMPKTVWEQQPKDEIREWKIIIDPGHGGEENVGCQSQNGLLEKDIVLTIAKQIQQQGNQEGYSIMLTRNEDVATKRIRRVQFSNQNQGHLFISLHCNASYSPNHKGIRIYLNNPNGLLRFRQRPIPLLGKESLNILTQDDFIKQSKDFAEVLQKEMNFLAEDPIKISELPLISLSDVYMPAVQIELGYLSNLGDVTRLSKPEHITQLSRAIVRAIQIYSVSVNTPSVPNGTPAEDSTDSD